MKQFDWKETELGDLSYYYNTEDGRIRGQTHKIAHTKIWLSKVMKENNEEVFLGHFISERFSRKSIEQYWLIQERTLLEQ